MYYIYINTRTRNLTNLTLSDKKRNTQNTQNFTKKENQENIQNVQNSTKKESFRTIRTIFDKKGNLVTYKNKRCADN